MMLNPGSRHGVIAALLVQVSIGAALAQQYELVDLGTLGGSSSGALAISEEGVIAGYAALPNSAHRAAIWVDGQVMDLGPPPGGGVGRAVAVNGSGQVAVTVEGGDLSYFAAFLWEDGRWTHLGALPGRGNAIAEGIDEAGRVVGRSFNSGDGSSSLGFVWDAGVMTGLDTLGVSGAAYGTAPAGPIVGSSRIDLGGGFSTARAVTWEDGVIRELGLLDGEDEGQAFAGNAAGDVVGTCWHIIPPQFFSAYQATMWSADGRIVDLGLTPAHGLACVDGFPFWTANIAYGVNSHGDVVGHAHCIASGGAKAAFLWRDGVNHNLEDLTVNLGGWTLLSAKSINDAGQIVGFGLLPRSSYLRAFLLEPVIVCEADFNGDGSVDTVDVLAFLNAWSAGEPSADFNGDGSVDTLDVLAFLNAWSAGC